MPSCAPSCNYICAAPKAIGDGEWQSRSSRPIQAAKESQQAPALHPAHLDGLVVSLAGEAQGQVHVAVGVAVCVRPMLRDSGHQLLRSRRQLQGRHVRRAPPRREGLLGDKMAVHGYTSTQLDCVVCTAACPTTGPCEVLSTVNPQIASIKAESACSSSHTYKENPTSDMSSCPVRPATQRERAPAGRPALRSCGR